MSDFEAFMIAEQDHLILGAIAAGLIRPDELQNNCHSVCRM